MASGIELLADPTRRRIIALLAECPHRPSVIARALGRSRPTVTHHLRLMEEAGLVRVLTGIKAEGRHRLHAIDPRASGRILAWLAGTEVGLTDSQRGPEPAGVRARHRFPRG